MKKARRRALDIGGWYLSPVHPLQGSDLENVGYSKGSCPKAEKIINALIHIPTNIGPQSSGLKKMIELIAGAK